MRPSGWHPKPAISGRAPRHTNGRPAGNGRDGAGRRSVSRLRGGRRPAQRVWPQTPQRPRPPKKKGAGPAPLSISTTEEADAVSSQDTQGADGRIGARAPAVAHGRGQDRRRRGFVAGLTAASSSPSSLRQKHAEAQASLCGDDSAKGDLIIDARVRARLLGLHLLDIDAQIVAAPARTAPTLVPVGGAGQPRAAPVRPGGHQMQRAHRNVAGTRRRRPSRPGGAPDRRRVEPPRRSHASPPTSLTVGRDPLGDLDADRARGPHPAGNRSCPVRWLRRGRRRGLDLCRGSAAASAGDGVIRSDAT